MPQSSHKDFAIRIAKKAGDIIRANFTLGMKKEWKGDNTPVTATDLEINQLVLKALKEYFPDHSLLAEEESNLLPKSDFVWVCDPVDGTIPFSHGIPTCVFSLALVKSGVPILGVVYDPFMDRLFLAEKGSGALCNNKKINVSGQKTFKNSLAYCVWWKGAKFQLPALFAALQKRGAKTIDLGSVVYVGALLAAGELAGLVWPGTTSWDIAATKILVEEAGGKVTDISGSEQRYDREVSGCIASNGLVHEELVELVRQTTIRNS